jgi:hypothetical protein
MTDGSFSTGLSAPSRRRRGWGQFSLVSLLLLAVVGCLVGAYLGERRQRKETEEQLRAIVAENRQYRIDLGIVDDNQRSLLVINDSKAVHVRCLPTHEEMRWRFRVYLPPHKRWRLCMGRGARWDAANGYDGPAFTELREAGELTFDTKIARDLDGQLKLEMFWGNRGFGTQIPDTALPILRSPSKRTVHLAGVKGQETHAAQGRIELVRWHVDLPDNSTIPAELAQVGRPQPPSSYGFCIYLEEILPGQGY